MNNVKDLQCVLGGVNYVATMRDGSQQEVKIRELPIRILTTQWDQAVIRDQASLTEIYCDKEEGWDDQLLPDAHEEIVRIGYEINFPRFARWGATQRATVKALSGLIDQAKAEMASLLSSTKPASSSEQPTTT